MKQIKNLKDLKKVSKLSKILFCPFSKRPNRTKVSSCSLIKQSGESLLNLFEKGLYVYEPKTIQRKFNKAV